ncbi:hypothetical protein V2J09_003285 [Rumex salicifolius]
MHESSMEPGKLFVGGISWDTNEDRLREYFETFGEVVEAVIMKDRNTGRARGFGFIIYADPSVADVVVKQKHVLDGRTDDNGQDLAKTNFVNQYFVKKVEAKKAVPRDDQQGLSKVGNNSVHGSPSPVRTKKIFVGGLPSTITESDFKRYFDQFGIITDVVVMYDHNTQRPRGFGFITYDSEEAVERVLIKSFHELSGKMVEVKRAVPKEFSPGPTRVQVGGSYGLNRVNGFMNGYNPNLFGGLGMRIDDRYSPVPISVGRSGFPSMGPTSFGTPLINELRMNPNNRETLNLVPNMGYERGMPAFYNGGNAKRNENFGEYDGTDGASASSFGSTSWSLWGNGSNSGSTYPTNSGTSSINAFRNGNNSSGTFNRIEAIWGSSPVIDHTGRTPSPSNLHNLNYGRTDVTLEPSHGNNNVLAGSSFSASNGGFEANNLQDLYGGGNGGLSWISSPPEFNGPTSFELGLGNSTSEVPHKNPGVFLKNI